MQASCDLPSTCPSVTCAAVFVPYMQHCTTMLETMPGVPFADFQNFAASCERCGRRYRCCNLCSPNVPRTIEHGGAAQADSMFPAASEEPGGALASHWIPFSRSLPVLLLHRQ